MLMGVFHPDLDGIQVRVLERLGADHALVVWGRDGIDEISLSDTTLVGELRDGKVREFELTPEEFGFARAAREDFAVADAAESKTRVLAALGDEPGPVRDIVLLNAGAALYAANAADSIAAGVAKAREAVASGGARAKLEQFLATTRRLAGA
jgi:anthranilate phosphoribosyltransferase